MRLRLAALGAMAALLLTFSASAGEPPAPTFFLGDVNCDSSVNSIDAALVLQLDAALIDALLCPDNADLNLDRVSNSVDAGLVLQYGAGLVPGFITMSLNVTRPEGLCDDAEKPTVCNVPAGTEFGLSISLNNPPPEGYVAIQTKLYYGNLTYNPTTFADEEVVWPDAGLSVRARPGGGNPSGTEGLVLHGSQTASAAPFRLSSHRGELVALSMSCPFGPESLVLALLPYSEEFSSVNGSGVLILRPDRVVVPALTADQGNVDLDHNGTIDPNEMAVPIAARLQINCVTPPP